MAREFLCHQEYDNAMFTRLHPRGFVGALALVGLALSPRSARAQDDLTRLPIESLMDIKITAASRYEQTSLNAPAAISVWTRAELTALGCRTFADAIRLIRGLHLRNDGAYSYLGTRGFQRPGDYNSRVLVLLDGLRLNDPVYGGSLSGTEFYLDIEAIERIEFASGASSAVYGESAFLGVLNVITRRGETVEGAELSAEVASEGFLKGRVAAGAKSSGVDWFVSASGWNSAGRDEVVVPAFDSPQSPGGIARNVDGEDWRGIRAAARTRHWDFSALYVNRGRDLTIPYGEGVFGDTRNRIIDEQFQVSATWSQALSARADLFVTGSFGDYGFDGTYVYDYPPITENKELAWGRWWQAESRLVQKWKRHTLLGGVEAQWNVRQDQQTYDVQPRRDYLDDQRSSFRLGAYVQDEWHVTDKVALHLGGRVDRYELPTPRSVFNPRGALVFEPTPSTAIKFLFGQAFRAPSVYELYYLSNDIVVNEDLKSETVKNYEAVVEHSPSPGFRLQASAFHYEILGLVQLANRSGDGALQYENLGATRARGLEAEVQWRRPSFALRGSGNVQDVKDDGVAGLAVNAPKWLAKLAATKSFGHGVSAGLDVEYVGARKTPKDTSAPGYWLTNLALSRSLNGPHRWGFVAGVKNLFDQRYFDPADQEAKADLFPLPGRALFFRLLLRTKR